ncbi:MAG: DUF4439 domain-containing protein [Candidatus Eremiobacteraeota bacterium]|nr:DUF4439 domain-containing protein [Candidatus Eremiobacteraeota bacterium]
MSSPSRASALAAIGTLALIPFASSIALGAERTDPADQKTLSGSIASEEAAIKSYDDALAANVLTPPVAAVVTRFRSEHAAQRDALVAALGGATPQSATPAAAFEPESLKSEGDVLAYAYGFERTLAAAYLQTVASYKNREYATLAASIMGVTTTHVALLAEALRRSPAYPSAVVTA